MLLSSLCSAMSTYFQKKLYLTSPNITPYEAVYWGSILNVIVYYIALKKMGKSPYECIPKRFRTTLTLRGIVGVFSNAFGITSIKMIALTKSSLIYWTCPIFTAIFAWLHLNEKITSYDWAAALIAFSGIIIMQNPFN
jgi:drug/metabolite transporter (DMT)-like permease